MLKSPVPPLWLTEYPLLVSTTPTQAKPPPIFVGELTARSRSGAWVEIGCTLQIEASHQHAVRDASAQVDTPWDFGGGALCRRYL